MSDPQDSAEAYDEETIGADPDVDGRLDVTPDDPYLVDEELTTEPISDSVASREERLEPDDDAALAAATNEGDLALMEADLSEALIADEIGVVGDEDDLSAEEAAIHLVAPDE